MQILEGDLLRKMNSSRTKREIKGRKKECEQEEKNASRTKREIKGRKKEREQEEKEREQEETRDKRTKERTRAGRNMARDVFRMQASKAISVHKIIE